jgi:L-2-hydroxyglutarate oxidase LhgO
VVAAKGNWSKIIDHVECVVIGAGIIGLACARDLAMQGKEVVILEAAATFGTETSSRHSEVIHAGIYYPPGTYKAKLCVAGKQQLYAYCKDKHIPHKQIGKLIVASQESEIATLHDIKAKAAANGVTDLEFLNAAAVHALEPNVAAVAALLSPSTGIIDSHAYMLALLGDAEAHGAMLAVNSKVISGIVTQDGIVLEIQADDQLMTLQASCVINCAGLYASKISAAISGLDAQEIPQTYYRKGSYFTYAGASPFTRLIYPVPVPGGLGTHSTVDLSGQVRFGPDVEWIEAIDYGVAASKGSQFAQSIQRFWPKVQEALLQPGYAGIRPVLAGIEGGFRDFNMRRHTLVNSTAKFIGLYGIESPGLTSSLAIAATVAAMA